MTRILPQMRHMKYLVFSGTLALVLACTQAGFADTASTAEWNITADKVTRFDNPERIEAEGNIVLTKREKVPPPSPIDEDDAEWAALLEEEVAAPEVTPDDLASAAEPEYQTTVTIKADWMSYDTEKESIHAKGHIVVDSGDDQMYAEEANINLSNEIGSMSNATITRKDHDLHLEGKQIEKTGAKTYHIVDGWVVTCKVEEGDAPPWSFSSSEATIEQGGYAILKNAKFNIKDIPVFYSPYLIVPVKDTRQSGLLFPEISHSSRDGFGLDIPFFWNISDYMDMTLYAEYYSERGFMPGLDFRYVLNEDSQGRFSASFLDDALSDPDEEDYYNDTGYTHTNSDRYWIRGKVDQTFGDDWITRLDIDVVSDRDYLDEFHSGLTGFKAAQKSYLSTYGRGFENKTDDERENTLNVFKAWNSSSLTMSMLAINDVRYDANDTLDSPLWKLPSIDYAGAIPIMDSSLMFDWDADYVNYWQEDGVGGQRVDMHPRVNVPIPLSDYLESSAEAGVRGTMYQVETDGDGEWDYDDTPGRFLLTFETDVATTLVRDYYKDDGDPGYLSHSIRPFVEYSYMTGDDDDELPYWDSVDLIEDENVITYGVDSFFDFYKNDDDYFYQGGYIRIEQDYSLDSEDSDEPFSEITMKLGWRPIKRMAFAYKTLIPVEDDQNTVHGFAADYTNSRGDSFSLDYSYNDDNSIEQINASMDVRVLPVLQLEFDIEHSLYSEETNDSTLALTYIQPCWSVKLKGYYSQTEERVAVIFSLANIGAPLGVSF